LTEGKEQICGPALGEWNGMKSAKQIWIDGLGIIMYDMGQKPDVTDYNHEVSCPPGSIK
jgi:hypothetical protein